MYPEDVNEETVNDMTHSELIATHRRLAYAVAGVDRTVRTSAWAVEALLMVEGELGRRMAG